MFAITYDDSDVLGYLSMQWRRQRSKKPDHFEVRKSSTRMHFFLKKVDDLFTTVKMKQIKRSDMVTHFCFSVHTITEAKQYAGLGRAKPGLEPGRWIFQPGHFTWRTLRRHCFCDHVVDAMLFVGQLNRSSAQFW